MFWIIIWRYSPEIIHLCSICFCFFYCFPLTEIVWRKFMINYITSGNVIHTGMSKFYSHKYWFYISIIWSWNGWYVISKHFIEVVYKVLRKLMISNLLSMFVMHFYKSINMISFIINSNFYSLFYCPIYIVSIFFLDII